MENFHEFLFEHAKFPFPPPDVLPSVDTTDISLLEAGLLSEEWRAEYAVRDDALVQKLCDTLKNILGDTALSDKFESYLLSKFSPRLELDECGFVDQAWSGNPSEAKASFQKISYNPG